MTTYEMYVRLHSKVLALEDRGDETEADAVRDQLDPIWYSLTAEEQDRFSFNAEAEMQRYQ